MKSFGQKAWVLPQPILIIDTYNSDGTQRTILCQRGNDFLPTFTVLSLFFGYESEDAKRTIS